MGENSGKKMDPRVAAQLKEMAENNPDAYVDLIITVSASTDPQSLAVMGLKVEHSSFGDTAAGGEGAGVMIVSGKATASQALEISALPQVKQVEIEIPGDVHALGEIS